MEITDRIRSTQQESRGAATTRVESFGRRVIERKDGSVVRDQTVSPTVLEATADVRQDSVTLVNAPGDTGNVLRAVAALSGKMPTEQQTFTVQIPLGSATSAATVPVNFDLRRQGREGLVVNITGSWNDVVPEGRDGAGCQRVLIMRGSARFSGGSLQHLSLSTTAKLNKSNVLLHQWGSSLILSHQGGM